MDEQLETIEQLKVTIIDLAVRFGPKLLAAILVLIAGILLSRWLGRWFDRGVARIELEPPIRLLLSRVARVLLLALFVDWDRLGARLAAANPLLMLAVVALATADRLLMAWKWWLLVRGRDVTLGLWAAIRAAKAGKPRAFAVEQ